MSAAAELIARIHASDVITRGIHNRMSAAGEVDMAPADEARWDAAETERSDALQVLRRLVVDALGVHPDDLTAVL